MMIQVQGPRLLLGKSWAVSPIVLQPGGAGLVLSPFLSLPSLPLGPLEGQRALTPHLEARPHPLSHQGWCEGRNTEVLMETFI